MRGSFDDELSSSSMSCNVTIADHQNRIFIPMAMHPSDTHGLIRSPIREAFQKTPRNPSLVLSTAGARSLMYVHVQMTSNTTHKNDWKSNKAASSEGRWR